MLTAIFKLDIQVLIFGNLVGFKLSQKFFSAQLFTQHISPRFAVPYELYAFYGSCKFLLHFFILVQWSKATAMPSLPRGLLSTVTCLSNCFVKPQKCRDYRFFEADLILLFSARVSNLTRALCIIILTQLLFYLVPDNANCKFQ